jgi:hypothetical protein
LALQALQVTLAQQAQQARPQLLSVQLVLLVLLVLQERKAHKVLPDKLALKVCRVFRVCKEILEPLAQPGRKAHKE